MDILNVEKVCKSFGATQAVRDLSLSVAEGTMYGLLGPNGAGKTTTIRMITSIIMPDTGVVRLWGKPSAPALLDQVGYLPEERGLYPKMKVGDVLVFFAEMKGVRGREARRRAYVWLERFGMTETADKKIEQLSRGNQQKIQLVATLLHEPRLLILDEPFTGLDPVNAELVKDILLDLKNTGACVIISTHLMENVEKLCDAICLINRGVAVLEGRLADIKRSFGRNTVVLEYEGESTFLGDLDCVSSLNDYGQYVEVHLTDPALAQELLMAAAASVTVRRFELVEPTLRKIFIETVQGNDAAGAESEAS